MKVIAEDEIWYDFFYTDLTTDLRQGEICGLKLEDFDEAIGTLKVCRTVYRETGGGLTAGDTKTNAGTRKIVLSSSTITVLRERKKSTLTEWIFPNQLKPEQPTNLGSAYRQLKVLLKRAGLPNICFHDLRHTCAIIFAQNQPIIGRFSHIHRHNFVVYAQYADEKTVKEAQKTCFWFARDVRG